MMEKRKDSILIIQASTDIAKLYKDLLGDQYNIIICITGKDAKRIIERGDQFDLVIFDIILPVEEDHYLLEDCKRTGIRLLVRMLEQVTSLRFYAITIRDDMKQEVERLCRKHGVILKFETSMEYRQEMFLENVENLLRENLPFLVIELNDHLNTIESYNVVGDFNSLSKDDISRIYTSLYSVEELIKTNKYVMSSHIDHFDIRRRLNYIFEYSYLKKCNNQKLIRKVQIIKDFLASL